MSDVAPWTRNQADNSALDYRAARKRKKEYYREFGASGAAFAKSYRPVMLKLWPENLDFSPDNLNVRD